MGAGQCYSYSSSSENTNETKCQETVSTNTRTRIRSLSYTASATKNTAVITIDGVLDFTKISVNERTRRASDYPVSDASKPKYINQRPVSEPSKNEYQRANSEQPGSEPRRNVTFKVNDVKPTGEGLKTLTTADILSSVKLIDSGAHSEHPRDFVESQLKNGFVGAVALAFGAHLPLSLRPEHFWTLILQGVAAHMAVKDNAEALRGKFVKHDGRKVLRVIRNDFILGKPCNDWAGVVTEFDQQVSANLVPGAMEAMAMNFSSTTADEKTCGTVAVMSAMKKFFKYKVFTRCGFPSITLEGSLEDWRRLRHKAEALVRTRCLPELSKRWLPAMLPVLDRFVRQYQNPNDVDVAFWQCMCKRGGMRGSGGYNWLNGWFNVFMPYLKDNQSNDYCVPYSVGNGYVQEGLKDGNYYEWGYRLPEGLKGPHVDDMPAGLATAPVMWEYCGTEIPMEFLSGFVGVEKREGGGVSPCLGWYIQHQTLSEEMNDSSDSKF